jgi:surface antigen Omp85-like protein
MRIENKSYWRNRRLSRRMSPLLILGFAIANVTIATAQPCNSEFGPVSQENKQQSQSSTNVNDDPSDSTKQEDDQKNPKDEKRGSLVIAPIPISSPAFGSGLLLIVGYVFKVNQEDKTSSPSWFGGAGAFTNNGSRGLALGSRLYFSENKYQTTVAVIKGRVNLDFFGIGRIPNRPPISVPLHMEGTIFFGEFLRNVGKRVFIGPRYQHRRLNARNDGEVPPGGFEVPAIDIRSNSAALGFHIQRDLRDSTFYPTKGTLFDFTADFFDQVWGSRREYQTYKIAYNGFRELRPRQIFAYRAMACSANGSVPFYDLCLFGFNSDLRGYTTGEFQNRRMFAGQAEYRVELRKRLGIVAFGGVGGVARRWGEFRSDQLLPAAGAGLRFNLDKKNHINYRIDFAVGREGRTVSIGVGEAF